MSCTHTAIKYTLELPNASYGAKRAEIGCFSAGFLENAERIRMFIIGCHLSCAKGFLAMAKTAVSLDANTFQFFTRNPRGGRAKQIDRKDVAAFSSYVREHAIVRILAHAPYTLNPASAKQQTRDFALMVLAEDLARMEEIPCRLYNMHPGCAVGQSVDTAIENIAEALNRSLLPMQTTTLLLETMSGKGTEVGGTFEQLAAIIARVRLRDHVGVCLDTCHVWDAGYDIVNNLDGVLEEFDRIIGLDRLCAVHLNDSMNVCGSHKDRHARIGEGMIGFTALTALINHPQLRDLPFYLETPNPALDGYRKEIAALRHARNKGTTSVGDL